MDFDKLNNKITLGWIIFGLLLLMLNIYTKKVLFKTIGIACLVTSISTLIITTIFSLYPQYFYIKIALLIILSIVIFLSIRKITKTNQIPEKAGKA